MIAHHLPGNSVLHKLDPRTKLFCTLILMVGIFAAHRDLALLSLFIAAVGCFLMGGIPLQKVVRNLIAFAPLFAITFAIHLFSNPGHDLFAVPLLGWRATLQGLQAGVLFTLRMADLIMVMGLFLSLTAPQDLTDGLERLAAPLTKLGLPIAQGALTISIALRFAPVLLDEATRIRRAQISRGARLDGSALLRLHRFLPIILPLFAGALQRADDLALALEARGYRGGPGRTRMNPLRFSRRDAVALCVILLIAFVAWVLN
jgi:energy-coupling factor transport system permease protein